MAEHLADRTQPVEDGLAAVEAQDTAQGESTFPASHGGHGSPVGR